MFFRKRKSEWFRGLLWAEEQAKGGSSLWNIQMWTTDPESFDIPSPWFCNGVSDFCAHAAANNLYPVQHLDEI